MEEGGTRHHKHNIFDVEEVDGVVVAPMDEQGRV